MKKLKKLITVLLVMLMLSTMLSACDESEYMDEEYEEYTTPDNPDTSSGKSNALLSVDKETGELIVNRPRREQEVPMGEDGTWTIFVYLCGSDLESENGMGTDDINEMLSATGSDNVRFVVETGGSAKWYNDDVSVNSLQRFVIQNEQMEMVDEKSVANMGDTAVITDFLRWGVKEYPAAHMGVVFWNHGGGSITGVCFDENNNSDSLSLLEIDSALYSIYDEMTDRFEFVGFDACLMGTVETANVLASYARYMIGSEETEPGSGWDYTAIGNFLAENNDANGEEVGRVICDSFLEACKAADDDSLTTLSVIDLDKIDDLLKAFNTFAKSMYESGADAGTLSDMIRGIEGAENFGGNNRSEGYTNMVDLAALIEACSNYTSNASEAVNAIKSAVLYKVSGETHKDAAGLAVYYPLGVEGSNELSVFESVCISPYYMSFIDRQNLGGAYATGSYGSVDYDDGTGEYEEGEYVEGSSGQYWYDEEGWYDDSWCYDDDGNWDSGNDYEYDEANSCYRKKTRSKTHWEYADKVEPTGESRLITFKRTPSLNSEGIYSFELSAKGLENAAAVYAYIYQISDDGKDYIEIGETFDVDADWENGVFGDLFDGYWLSLPDGQNLATYIVDYDEDYIIYTSPILLNGKETNLRMRQDNEGNVTIEGAWDGIDANGAASRKITKLKDGDVIVPLYFSVDSTTFEEGQWSGAEYKIKGTPEILYGFLDEADYLYSFIIDDVYYDYYQTEYECFHVGADGETYYYE